MRNKSILYFFNVKILMIKKKVKFERKEKERIFLGVYASSFKRMLLINSEE